MLSLGWRTESEEIMDTATVQTGSLLEKLVRRYQVCWDVWPEEAMVEGKRRQIGFELELSGTHLPEVSNASSDLDDCQEVFCGLLEIAEYILPSKSDRPSEYLIGPYE